MLKQSFRNASPLRLRTITSAALARGKRVLLRVGWDDPPQLRIERTRKTLNFLIRHGCRVILCAYRGRPEGRYVAALSLKPTARLARRMLNIPLTFVPATSGALVERAASRLKPGQCMLLENTRFDPREEANDPGLAREWATLCDLYIDDSFSTAHRAYASTEAITHQLPSYAGFGLSEEVTVLSKVRSNPRRPLVVIVSGAKVSTKIVVLKKMFALADTIVVGGGIANTILAARGCAVGSSLVDRDHLAIAKVFGASKKLIPIRDVVVSRSHTQSRGKRIVQLDDRVHPILPDESIVDIGPLTMAEVSSRVARARTVVWNGPLGIYEVPAFRDATRTLISAIHASKALSVIGGGDTIDALESMRSLNSDFSLISTGGGAMIEFLEGRALPGIKPLIR